MAQKNETLILISALLISAAILSGGYWQFTRYGNLNLTDNAESYPYQHTLYYIYQQPITSAVRAFLGYVTSPKGEQVIQSVEFN